MVHQNKIYLEVNNKLNSKKKQLINFRLKKSRSERNSRMISLCDHISLWCVNPYKRSTLAWINPTPMAKNFWQASKSACVLGSARVKNGVGLFLQAGSARRTRRWTKRWQSSFFPRWRRARSPSRARTTRASSRRRPRPAASISPSAPPTAWSSTHPATPTTTPTTPTASKF